MTRQHILSLLAVAFVGTLGACGGSSSNTPAPPPPPPAAITIDGVVSDGEVEGGRLYVFTADTVIAALAGLTEGGNRAEELAAAGPIATLERVGSDAAAYTIEVPGEQAGNAAFFIFDNVDSNDRQFGDTPPNLESVVVLPAAGDTARLNVSMHATLIAQLVRAQLDPDGDGTPVDTASIQTLVQGAKMNVLGAAGADARGNSLFPNGEDPLESADDALIHGASGTVGGQVRAVAALTGLSVDDVVAAFSADAGDGTIDGTIPPALNPTDELIAMVTEVAQNAPISDGGRYSMFAQGPCSTSAVSLRRACAFDLFDDNFEALAVCANISDDAERDACALEGKEAAIEKLEECGAVFEARLELCADLDDAAHEPEFGEQFAANFVDPSEIGSTVEPNPFFPLVAGNRWVYEGDGEQIVVEVTTKKKLIEGIECVTVNDVVTEDGALVEDTDDWYAQDVDGNVWYCGEIAENYESFEGDNPDDPELVDIEGSWKAGRDGAKPGVLLPFSPELETVIRQEVLFGEAEDFIEILSLTASESAPGGSCVETCLQTFDGSPLEPEAQEHKFYAPGVGLIVEVDLESGGRVELMEFTQNSP